MKRAPERAAVLGPRATAPSRPAGVPPADWRDWLAAPGSLTARVRRHGRHFEVRVLAQGRDPWLPGERAALRVSAARGAAHVREVALCLDGVPVVLARSVAAGGTLRGPWRALLGLGTRPLAELLFGQRHLRRGPLQVHRIGRAGALRRRVERLARLAGVAEAAAAAAPGAVGAPLWARSRVFERRGARLQVMEVFLPALQACRATHERSTTADGGER